MYRKGRSNEGEEVREREMEIDDGMGDEVMLEGRGGEVSSRQP